MKLALTLAVLLGAFGFAAHANTQDNKKATTEEVVLEEVAVEGQQDDNKKDESK